MKTDVNQDTGITFPVPTAPDPALGSWPRHLAPFTFLRPTAQINFSRPPAQITFSRPLMMELLFHGPQHQKLSFHGP